MDGISTFTLSWLKVVLVLLTDGLGVLGFFIDQKDKKNPWRWIILVAIIVSATLEAVAQHLSDASDAERPQWQLDRSTKTIEEIQRTLTSVDGMGLSAVLVVSCSEPAIVAFCSATKTESDASSTQTNWDLWPVDENGLLFSLEVGVFSKTERPPNWQPSTGLSRNLSFVIDIKRKDIARYVKVIKDFNGLHIDIDIDIQSMDPEEVVALHINLDKISELERETFTA